MQFSTIMKFFNPITLFFITIHHENFNYCNEKWERNCKVLLPSLCRSKPLADVARFFADPSPSSRSELRRVNGEMLVLQATF
jgi:hypothetical protein